MTVKTILKKDSTEGISSNQVTAAKEGSSANVMDVVEEIKKENKDSPGFIFPGNFLSQKHKWIYGLIFLFNLIIQICSLYGIILGRFRNLSDHLSF